MRFKLLHINFIYCILYCISVLYASDGDEALPFSVLGDMIVIEAQVDGIRGNFIFDTGAKEVILHSTDMVYDRAIELITCEGSVWAEERAVQELIIGDRSMEHVPVLAMDLSSLSVELGVPISGILGWSAIGHDEITIDYESATISSVSPSPALDDPHYDVVRLDMQRIMDDLPVVEVSVRDRSMLFAFDTGAPISVIHKDAKRGKRRSWRVNKLYVEDIMLTEYLRVENSLLRGEDLSAFQDLEKNVRLDGILSVSSLDTKKIYFDRRSERIYLFWKKGQLDRRLAIAD